MAELIVVSFSLFSIVVMVLLIRATRIAHPVVLETDAPVEQTIAEHFEGAKISRIVRNANDGSAIVYLHDAPGLVLVRALGDRMAVRVLNNTTLKALTGEGAHLDVLLNDFTWPKIRLGFTDETARRKEEEAINSTIKGVAHA